MFRSLQGRSNLGRNYAYFKWNVMFTGRSDPLVYFPLKSTAPLTSTEAVVIPESLFLIE